MELALIPVVIGLVYHGIILIKNMKKQRTTSETPPPYFALGKPEDVAETQRQIKELVQPWYTDEELFDTKVNMGFAYLDDRMMPPDVKKKLRESKPFWDWFNAMWHISDRKILKGCKAHGLEQIPRRTYENTTHANICIYQVNEVVMKMAQKEAEKLREATLMNN